MKTSTFLAKMVLFAGVILSETPVFSQSKFEISGGVGIPEMTSLKIKYGKVIQIGLSQSFFPFSNNVPLGPTSLEIYYHLAGKSKFNEHPTWYLIGGLGYFWSQKEGIYYKFEGIPLCFYPRIGRHINFSKSTGINFETGAFIPFWNLGVYVWPSAFISFFVRL
ncbi:MAG: hypothetical protein NTY95_14750 [Bacteroidia bacterium]|nr:hypothetical protein [Bacteroidia bacterium]